MMHTTQMISPPRPASRHDVAPWWMAYMFLFPLRRLWEHPRRLLGPWARPGDRVLELGCGMGFFTLDLARIVGHEGRVVAVDVEPRALAGLRRRAGRRRLLDRIETRTCTADDPGVNDLAGTCDLVVAHHVIHETRDPAHVLGRLAAAVHPGGRLWLAEPRGHVSARLFDWEVAVARRTGLEIVATPPVPRNMAVVLRRPNS